METTTFQYPFQNPALSIEDRVEDLISQMTLEEKISQMRMSSDAIERLGIPAYDWWNESLHGVARNGRATIFPQAIGMAASFDPELMQEVAGTIAEEARAKYNISSARDLRGRYQGLTFWTPNINIFRDPRWGRGQETYGEDPYLTSRMGVAYVKGLQGDHPKYIKAAGMGKHYAVHSGPEALRHEFDAQVSMKDLWETYLPAFEALVTEAKVEGIMGAYNRTNGIPCCAHPYLIKEVLRDKWGFKGYFVSDCWALGDFYHGHNVVKTPEEAAALAINNGCNLNCGDTYAELKNAIEQGFTSEEALDQNLRELLPTRFRLGLFDPPGSTPWDHIGPEKIHSEDHLNLSRKMAAESFVLLKNDRHVLPLDKEINRIFVTGPMATHAQALLANYYGVSENLVTFLEGIVGNAPSHTAVNYQQGTLMDIPNRNPSDWASGSGSSADVTIACLGISQLIEGEEGESIASEHMGDRVDLHIPQNQIDYLKKLRASSQNLVVVLTAGSALDCREVYELADALLYVWYPGEQGGNALADILFGATNPSGRLPVTLPYSINDLPPFEDYAMKGRTYRYMEKEPMFPFGFGLSYTEFRYGDLAVSNPNPGMEETITVTTKVENAGDLAGDEVLQLYITDLEASVEVPQYALKAFKRVHLEPKEAKEVSFELSPDVFKIVNNKGERMLEPGDFAIYVGGTSPGDRSKVLGATDLKETRIAFKE
ncbi:MAG: glycoside hydrolase family 3 C-terminal domain-containing protein [Lewinellaceae bacterium]|nr:glycoside hydrolase family 3 C-terminal domain-containing protein [Lewinellaceae bacterium]